MQHIAWGARVPRPFIDRVLDICQGFNWYQDAPSDLMSCIAFESGETFSPSVKNMAGSGATGLIQFMPQTAIGLGTTTQQLERMTAVQQLDMVQRYFKPYAHSIACLSDMYMAILLPVYIGRDESSVLFSRGTVAYRQNAALDYDSDGRITKAEAAARVLAKRIKGLQPPNVLEVAAHA